MCYIRRNGEDQWVYRGKDKKYEKVINGRETFELGLLLKVTSKPQPTLSVNTNITISLLFTRRSSL